MFRIRNVVLLALILWLSSTLISTTENTVIADEEGTLTISVNGNGETSPPVGVYKYDDKKAIQLTAIPDPGWEFINWTGDVADPNSPSTKVKIGDEDNKTVTANFTEITKVTYDLTIVVNGNGNTFPAVGTYRYNENTEVDITATPDAGWQFDSWSGDVASPNSFNTMVTMDGDKLVTVNFSEVAGVTQVLTIATNGNGIASPSIGSHRYNENTEVDITATPDPGWQFDSWTGDVADPNSASTTVTMDGDKMVTANFDIAEPIGGIQEEDKDSSLWILLVAIFVGLAVLLAIGGAIIEKRRRSAF